MRSPYEDSAAVSTDNKYHTTSYSYNSNNNNNYHKNFNGNGNVNGNGNGNGIPYHARENSLPFSYGIAKTSTQLRKTPTPTRLDSFLDNDYVLSGSSSSNSSSHNNSNSNHHNNNNNNNNSASDMIKPQPRLTSPLLVRKTLANTNATSSKANANTSPNSNPNPNPNTNTISNTYHYGSAPRADFEQLLRERRDKVYSEYRDREKEREKEREMERTMSRVPPMPPQRRQSHNKYNYDFEFNLNLNDFSNERSSLPAPASASTPYATRNIEYRQDVDVPDGAAVHNARRLESTFVERNYHTINSKSHSLERTPMELTYKQQQRQHQQQQQFTTVEPQLEQHSHIYGQNHTRSRRDLSPIYAISAKRAPNSNGQQQQQQQYQQQQQQVDYLLTPSPTSRPETPAFPLTPRTPFSTPGSSVTQRTSPTTTESIYQTIASRQQQQQQQQQLNATPSPTFEVAADLVKFARNSAKFWYKSLLSREDAIALLMNAQPGTFLVRDSTTYKNAYGLVLRVAQPPAGSQELVRHFLIEPTQRGVRLKGCENEPTFTSLSALIYEHSINKLALPCLLRIPDADVVPGLAITTPAQQQLLTHGAATNVLWLFSCDTESLTGNEAIRKAIRLLYEQKPLPLPTEVHFKVSGQGITLTDNTRKKFFRKHYTADVISHCAIDPENRMWSTPEEPDKKTIFAFVARRSHSSKDNQCHVFSDLSVAQPAAAIVSFANRTLPTEKQRNYVL